MKRCWLLVVVFACGLASRAHGDWPHLRGPNYDGVSQETGLAEKWPANGPEQIWSRPLGKGHSGIIVGGGRLFTQWQSSSGQFLLCLDPTTGELIWETQCDRAWQHFGAYPGPYATPTFAGGKVYFASPSGVIGCADAQIGAIRWSFDVHERFGGRGRNFGFAVTPLVEDGKVILPVGGPGAGMVALDASTGATVWAVGDDAASYCPAMPITWNDRRAIVGYMENSLLLLSAADGQVLNRTNLSNGYDEHSAWPIYREAHLLLTAPFRVPARRLRLTNAENGGIALKESWSKKSLSNDVVSSVLYRDSVYGFDLKQLQSSAHRPSRGEFRCLDWETGAVRWSTDQVGHAAVLAADDKLFLLTDEGELILARAGALGYDELGRVALFPDEICWTPPTLWQGRLFVRSPSRLICLNVSAERIRPAPATRNISNPSKPWRFDSSWLLARERDFPNDAPTFAELRRWIGVSLLLIGASALAALGLGVVVAQSRNAMIGLMLTAAFVLGVIGPNLLSAATGQCLFTWPLAVFAVFHAAVRASVFEERSARVWIGALIVTCAAYFVACRAVGMSIGWYFVIGLPVGFPFAVCSTLAERKQRLVLAGVLMLAAFVAMVAGGQMFLLWNAGRAH